MYKEDLEILKTSTGRIMNVYPVEDPAFLEIRVKVLRRINYRILCDEERRTKQIVLEREIETYSSGERILIQFCLGHELNFWFRNLDIENKMALKKVVIEFLNNLPF